MTKNRSIDLVNAAIKGLQEVKGVDIVSIDLRQIDNTFCKYFVICNGTSNTHVNALADSAVNFIREECDYKPMHIEGRNNAQWILIDYADVIIHVFQKEYRELYKLENLWVDAIATKIKE